MIKSLKIQNFILIDNLEINFHEGFSTITGETGAGKSIILGAVSLMLGNRADASLILDQERKCVIEGEFSVDNESLAPVFEQNDLDFDKNILLRREILANGKSRAFVNDTPVNLNVIREIALSLIDVHSQHQNLNLKDSLYQLKVVDVFAGIESQVRNFRLGYHSFVKIDNEYKNLVEKAEKQKSDLDYYQFQFNQLDEVKLSENEQEDLENELKVLNHSEEILNSLQAVTDGITDSDNSVYDILKKVKQQLEKNTEYLPQAADFIQRIESAMIDLKDISGESENLKGTIEYSPARIEAINERLNSIYSLQNKHRVSTVKELIDIRNDFEEKIIAIENSDVQTEKLKKQRDELFKKLWDEAVMISEKRKKVISNIEKEITVLMKSLAVQDVSFKVSLTVEESLNEYGINRAEFLFSANKGIEPREVGKIASGGEIARLMLSIKSLQAKSQSMPTIIFDEIDTGVSGEIGDKMGKIMMNLSKDNQVVTITHLPQIAAKGVNHYKVFKDKSGTNIRLLNKNERIEEIAKMLSGEKLSDAAMDNARVLLSN
ncbi:MAG: DNA repair protein RecN [Bacteroidetes bacterium GWF2_38_335]|nr:MAG: DNA repair protein RecN [Bacteroidetes bacterium GWF2_38_335]OFY79503.1 MAG: DNA repair protein RecN [Bacteroidetes bacterium RIFOXYA12_FULL_38_20]HBS86558.1 DNA repair protein RecN [Bacteroidales bacterium]